MLVEFGSNTSNFEVYVLLSRNVNKLHNEIETTDAHDLVSSHSYTIT